MTASPELQAKATMVDARRRTGSLRPVELANAAVMAAVCSAIAVIAVTLPFAFPTSLLATVPMALLAYRHRLRVLVAATVAGTIIAFLVINLGGLLVVVGGAYAGGLVGIVKRCGRGAPTAFCAAVVAGTVFGLVGVAALTVLSRLRNLIFETITGAVDGVAAIIGLAPALAPIAQDIRDVSITAMQFWPLLVITVCVAVITFVAMFGWWALSRVLARLGGVPDVHKLDLIADRADERPVDPVPVTFRDVCFRYPGADHDALGPVNLTVEPGEHLAITGPNGSGKTTLLLLLSGRAPTSGAVERPGAVGLGRFGGTAVVMQHPESQVLGTRVLDDVVWGLPPDVTVDAEQLLAEVGLAGFGERDTDGLSGGELQRLAVAAALAREPRLLVADEVTSMVDQDGRNALIEVLAGLTQHHDMAMVNITHYDDEAATADRTVNLTSNAKNLDLVLTAPSPVMTSAPHHHIGDKMLELSGVTHRYGNGTPWESTALRDIDLAVGEGEGVLIHGLNGSGKSTLAWIMAGLLVPTTGSCLLDGESVSDQVGAVAISFQASRLQLMRGRVDLEIADAAGFDHHDRGRAEQALASVGLDPALMDRCIDQLSGGQMRRVVLAGLLARSPRAIILDEPLAGLDAASRRGLLSLLTDLRRNTGLTVIVISHDFSGLNELCPRAMHLYDGTLVPMPTTQEGTA
jgi:energy-coupling factor transport system ATP-binding protein